MVVYQGKQYESLPPDALHSMSERLSLVVSTYFSAHPEEYKAFLRWKAEKTGKEENI